MQGILDNPITHELKEFYKLFPDYSDLLITDQYGALVAATHHIDDYYQGDEAWWRTVWNNGGGAIYVSQPFFEESVQTYVAEIAVPVYLEGQVVGVIHGYYRLDRALIKVLETVEFETGGSRLYISPERYLGADGIVKDVPLSPKLLAHPPEAAVQYEGVSTFLSVEPVHTITETKGAEGALVDQAIADLNWRILVYQSSREALHPLTSSARVALITATGAFVLAIVLGSILAKIVSHPVQILIRTAQKVQSDAVTPNDLQQLDKIAEKRDEMGELATVFRDMSLVIMERAKSLSEEIADLQAQVDAGGQQASELELAYYNALCRKSAWLRQRLAPLETAAQSSHSAD